MRLAVGMAVAATSQLYLSPGRDAFRVSASVILFPLLLIFLCADSRRPDTGVVTAACVLVLRGTLRMAQGMPWQDALLASLPGAMFYMVYDALFCLLAGPRKPKVTGKVILGMFLCDLVSNLAEVGLGKLLLREWGEGFSLLTLVGVAGLRTAVAGLILWTLWAYRQWLLLEEHLHRYNRLFLMAAGLRDEVYFLKKDAEEIERVMSRAYRLYEELGDMEQGEHLRSMALDIAKDVHEVKKDNLRIIRGLESRVEEVYDQEEMRCSDLLSILADSTRRLLGEEGRNITVECRCGWDFLTGEHYRLISILKNLVTNAAEAIQAGGGSGRILVDQTRQEGNYRFVVRDNGPGIPQRALGKIFRVGYSTKFNPVTGDINRGVGLSAVRSNVEDLGGEITVESEVGKGTVFEVCIPVDRLEAEKA